MSAEGFARVDRDFIREVKPYLYPGEFSFYTDLVERHQDWVRPTSSVRLSRELGRDDRTTRHYLEVLREIGAIEQPGEACMGPRPILIQRDIAPILARLRELDWHSRRKGQPIRRPPGRRGGPRRGQLGLPLGEPEARPDDEVTEPREKAPLFLGGDGVPPPGGMESGPPPLPYSRSSDPTAIPPSPTPPLPPPETEGGRVATLTPSDEPPAPRLTATRPEPEAVPVPEEALDEGIMRPDPSDPVLGAALRGAFGRRYTAATIWRHWLGPALLRVASVTRSDLCVYLRECGANHEIKKANCPPGVAFAENRFDVWRDARQARQKPPPIPLPPAAERPVGAPRVELPRDPLSNQEIAARAAQLAKAFSARVIRRPAVPLATLTPEARALLAAERHNEEST